MDIYDDGYDGDDDYDDDDDDEDESWSLPQTMFFFVLQHGCDRTRAILP